MKHLFIPHELALLAKEKGFNEECLCGFNSDGKLIYGEQFYYEYIVLNAPTYDQILNWLDSKGVFVSNSYAAPDTNKFSLRIDCYTKGRTITDHYGHIYKTRNEAMNSGIKEAFKLI